MRGLELTDDQRECLTWASYDFRRVHSPKTIVKYMTTYYIGPETIRWLYANKHEKYVRLDLERMGT